MLLMLNFFLTLFTCFRLSTTEMKIDNGIPLSHAETLERLIRDNIFPNSSIIEFYGNITDADNKTLEHLENLEFSALDRKNLKGILELVKRNELIQGEKNSRRAGPGGARLLIQMQRTAHIRDKIMNFMKQTIYATRFRLEKIVDIQRRFHAELEFKIGFFYGNLMELKTKAGQVFSTMMKLNLRGTKFYWYLILYERLLSIHTDVSSTVRNLFILKEKEERRHKD